MNPTVERDASESAEHRLKTLRLELPAPPEPFGTYAEAVQTGNLLFLSGMLPTEGRSAKFIGRVGAELDVEAGRNAARLVLQQIRRAIGDFWLVANIAGGRHKYAEADNSCHAVEPAEMLSRHNHFRGNAVRRAAMATLITAVAGACATGETHVKYPTHYKTVAVDGLSIFYREAGPKDAPVILLLHGLPSSSRMFEPLFHRLSDRYHLVAPDYPGFGHSDWPSPKTFAYTFDHIADIMARFTETLSIPRYTLYMQDYGGPVGFRMALAHPERIESLIVQDAVAHNEGLGANWKTRRAYWADRAANESALRTNLLSMAATRTRHVGSDPNVERYDPDLWTDEYNFLNSPGQGDIQSDLFYDYRTNLDAYPKWQAWMREKQPHLLVIWGKYEMSFDISEPEAYRRDVPKAEVHILDGGHFALDTAADEIAELIRGFLK